MIVRPDGATLAEIAALVDAGALRPVVDRTFRLEDAAEAHRLSETGHARGKLVLLP
jgi:NADPH:quinone reductase-like Zn-dependent oxidoreductase